ncbi:uncharacterized protein LOC105172021 isoform X4 [Sesamum indicum]|uniref:Uncharacterized protein LOC105172021 isoform X4 n=1 Tax=Sesamum indicum TaxID=4182 RepID=A0A6I9TWU8_SESIN|nr:uncharacterized protein LOC105172021 isoform X4 [Sesamum indicum]
MDATEVEEALRVFEAALSQIKWRLKPASKRRLQTDILALCSTMRPCIMVDYGGKMPELGDHLCAFLNHCKKESSIFEHLRVMVIDDMVYLIQIMTQGQAGQSPAVMQLLSAQKFFSSVLHEDGVIGDHLQRHETYTARSSLDGHATSGSPELVDLSCCLQESQVTIPTLNGWLLGYPVIYLFGKDYIEHAVYSLSTKSLHIYQIFVNRVSAFSKGYQKEELMSFTVPFDLSMEGSNEPWAQSFLAHMRGRWENCKHIWGSLHLEVSGCYPQAIAL